MHEELSASDPGFALAYLAHSMLFVNNLEFNGMTSKELESCQKFALENGLEQWP